MEVKKKMVQTLKWATAHLSIKLGVRGGGLGAQAGVLGAGVRGTVMGAQAEARKGARHDAQGHGARRAGARGGAGIAGGAGARGCGRGRAGLRRAAQRVGASARCCDTTLRLLRHGQLGPATRRWAGHARAACARWLGQIGCLVHLTHFSSVFGLSTVPESLIRHCS